MRVSVVGCYNKSVFSVSFVEIYSTTTITTASSDFDDVDDDYNVDKEKAKTENSFPILFIHQSNKYVERAVKGIYKTRRSGTKRESKWKPLLHQYFYMHSLYQSSTCEHTVATTLVKLQWKLHYNDLSQHSQNEPNFSFRLPTRSRGKRLHTSDSFLPFRLSHRIPSFHQITLPNVVSRRTPFYRYGVLENLSKDFRKSKKYFWQKDSQKTTRRKKGKLRMTRERERVEL